MAEHAFYEAITHAQNRILYGSRQRVSRPPWWGHRYLS
jgi:hypothetical protein